MNDSAPKYNDAATARLWELLPINERDNNPDWPRIKQAIADGANIFAQDIIKRNYLLEYLIENGEVSSPIRKELLEEIIPQYAQSNLINNKNSNGHGFLHMAAHAKDADTIKLLLKYKADPNLQGSTVWPPLYNVSDAESFYALLDGGADFTLGTRLQGTVIEALGNLGKDGERLKHIGVFDEQYLTTRAKQLSDIYRKLYFERKAIHPNDERPKAVWRNNFPILISDEKAGYAATKRMWFDFIRIPKHSYNRKTYDQNNTLDHHDIDETFDLKDCLAKGADIKSTDLEGNNILACCTDTHFEMSNPTSMPPPESAVAMIDCGFSLTDKNLKGETPLMHWKPEMHEAFIQHMLSLGRQEDLLKIHDEHYDTLNEEQQKTWDNNFSAATERRKRSAPDSAVQRYLRNQSNQEIKH